MHNALKIDWPRARSWNRRPGTGVQTGSLFLACSLSIGLSPHSNVNFTSFSSVQRTDERHCAGDCEGPHGSIECVSALDAFLRAVLAWRMQHRRISNPEQRYTDHQRKKRANEATLA
jgi:hypothetical protein